MEISNTVRKANQDKEEIKNIFFELERILKEYSGFEITFPIKEKKDTLSFGARAKNYPYVPEISEGIITSVLERVKKTMDIIFEEYSKFDINMLQSIPRDLSLCYIFNHFLDLDYLKRHDFVKMVSELKKIGEKTYENEPVNIGVVYCPNAESIKDISSLNIDILPLGRKKSISNFFLEEKPFLRLIDKKSLAIAIDNNFKVFAILRKKSGEKSLTQSLENHFNECGIDSVIKATFNFLEAKIRELASHVTDSEDIYQDIIGEYRKKLTNNTANIQTRESPKYIYFSIHKKAIDIYTDQKFVISYLNGDWKLKHYNLMLAIILKLLSIELVFSLYEVGEIKFKRLFEDMKVGVLKLTDSIKKLSQSNSSTIFVILKDKLDENLSLDNAKKLLNNNSFKDNNLERNFLNVIRNKHYHLNIQESDQYLIETIASIDGAVIFDSYLNIVSFGEIINVPESVVYQDTFGTGTKAARYASRLGLAIKVSEDGDIYIFENEKLLLKI